jgi:quercetin dioxygenase-like cupin family protein
MEISNIDDMFKGWFVGNFEPTAFSTDAAEVAVKSYQAGETEKKHFHKIATEITLVLTGQVEMCNRIWGPGSIIVLQPGEATAFRALEATTNVVVKIPGALNDKYEID